jgi:AbrB family looped-hinge helix DNA binding protein
MTTTIDNGGRVVIPKPLRERAGLQAGQQVKVEYADGRIEIEPVSPEAKLVRRGSLLVAAAPPGKPAVPLAAVNEVARQLREDRRRSRSRRS